MRAKLRNEMNRNHGAHGALVLAFSLRAVAPDLPSQAIPAPEVEGVIVGGIASRVASEVLHGHAAKLPELTAPLVEYVLAFYRLGDTGPKAGRLVAFERDPRVAQGPVEAQRKHASA